MLFEPSQKIATKSALNVVQEYHVFGVDCGGTVSVARLAGHAWLFWSEELRRFMRPFSCSVRYIYTYTYIHTFQGAPDTHIERFIMHEHTMLLGVAAML